MWKQRAFFAGAVAVVGAAGWLVPIAGTAQNMLAEPPAVAAHIKVNRCDPERQVTSTSVGYAPGYYPGFGPYRWGDVYGYSYVQAPVSVSQSGTLAIDYVNVTPEVMAQIDFGLVANGRLVAEVRDVGTFSPHAEIKHKFGLNPNVFPLQTGLPQCVPLHIVYKNGDVWTNPHLPAFRRQIYGG